MLQEIVGGMLERTDEGPMPSRRADTARDAYMRVLRHVIGNRSRYRTAGDIASDFVREAQADGLQATIETTSGKVQRVIFSTGEAANYDVSQDKWSWSGSTT
jgi:hypothetical protein